LSTPGRFALVTETYPPEINGVALTLGRFANGLNARGFEISVVRPRQHGDGAAEEQAMAVAGLPLPGYRGLRFGLPAGAMLRARWVERRPDAVYVATEGPLGLSAVGAANALGIGVVSGFHRNFHRYVEHYGARWLQRPVGAYLRCFHNQTAATLVASEDLRRLLHAAGFRNLQVLGRGVDTVLFTPARRSPVLRAAWGATDDDLVVAYIGRLAGEKNIALAVDAYRAMQSVRPALRFVLVGDGPARESLQRAHPDLIFPGPCTGAELAAHYASADVFLFPSTTETFGNVTLEAMASGLGLVAYDYAAAHQHVTHTESGLLAPYGHRLAFIANAVRLACSPALLERIRRAARDAVMPVGWPQVVERFEALLMEATSPPRPAARTFCVLHEDRVGTA
jgi:glycosyltransferase involved in cell wall biosynthesis